MYWINQIQGHESFIWNYFSVQVETLKQYFFAILNTIICFISQKYCEVISSKSDFFICFIEEL